jgi:hypothetical protein
LELDEPDGRKVVVQEHTPLPEGYEPPSLSVLGTVHELTQVGGDKKYGKSDGFTFMGDSITWNSP